MKNFPGNCTCLSVLSANGGGGVELCTHSVYNRWGQFKTLVEQFPANHIIIFSKEMGVCALHFFFFWTGTVHLYFLEV
jgi:hypothetical protein